MCQFAPYYDPEIGRFITEDSYWGKDADPLSLNLYTYCYNNPIIFTDPSGHIIKPGYDMFYRDTLDLFVGIGSGILETYSYGVSNNGDEYYLRNNEVMYLTGKLVGNFLGGLGGVLEVGGGGAYIVGTGGVGAIAGGTVVVGHGATVIGSSYGAFSANYIKLAEANGGKLDKSGHAEIRDKQGRPVSEANRDLQNAKQSDILKQDDGRWIIRGSKGRIHVVDSNRTHITSFTNTNANTLKRIEEGVWNRPTIKQLDEFKKLFP
ncbi:MAG: hypothetical protein FIA99_10300, partial [Ruminiclostridium sp.]|nr:hypothetical protein [Ruminiclostridium sp.]